MTPPFRTPSKASYFFSGLHAATTSPFFGKLRICSPSGFAGPQPQQALCGAYCSWRDLSLIMLVWIGAPGGRACRVKVIRRVQTSPDTDAIHAQRKVSVA